MSFAELGGGCLIRRPRSCHLAKASYIHHLTQPPTRYVIFYRLHVLIEVDGRICVKSNLRTTRFYFVGLSYLFKGLEAERFVNRLYFIKSDKERNETRRGFAFYSFALLFRELAFVIHTRDKINLIENFN